MREDVICELEARLGGKPIDGSHVFEGVVTGILGDDHGIDDFFGRNSQRQFATIEKSAGEIVHSPRNHCLDGPMNGHLFKDKQLACESFLRGFCHYRSALSMLQFRMPLRMM